MRPGELPAKAPAADAIRHALSASVARLLDHEPGVRAGRDPEDVHQARVATRRLRSDLRTFRPLLQPDWATGLREELRWLAAELGKVRDAEVLRDRLAAATANLPPGERAAGLGVIAPLNAEVNSARRKLLAAMRSRRYRDLAGRLTAAAETPLLAPEAEAPGAEVIPPLVRRPWRRLRKAAGRATADSPDPQLHDLRIRAKRCRYAAEAAAPVVGRRATAFARAVAKLQDALGEWHDGVVAEAWLCERATIPELSADKSAAARKLAARQAAGAAKARRRWAAAWHAISTQTDRSWIT